MKPCQVLVPIALLALGGCALPIPTSKVAAPGIRGRVIDANTGQPIDMAGVLVKGYKEASVITARDGTFKTDEITRTSPFWVWWPFGGESLSEVELRVAKPGYEKRKHPVQFSPKTQRQVVLSQPISLERKSAEALRREITDRMGDGR